MVRYKDDVGVFIPMMIERVSGGFMRLRNIPGAQDAILESAYVVQEPEKHKGSWGDLFEKKQPLHIEVGMGKGCRRGQNWSRRGSLIRIFILCGWMPDFCRRFLQRVRWIRFT